MKLLNVVTARSIWLIDIRELNPTGKSFLADLIGFLQEQYEFTKVPSSPGDIGAQGGLLFAGGSFEIPDGEFVNVDLTIYNDGLVATTQSSTRSSDLFLDQTIALIVETFKLTYDPSMIRKKAYLSEVNVKTDRHIGSINPRLEAFASRLNSLFSKDQGVRFEPSAIGFWPDPELPAGRPGPFTFERKLNAPYSERKYYSQAPVDTETHLELLNELDNLLTSDVQDRTVRE